jgi:hypothetical protein
MLQLFGRPSGVFCVSVALAVLACSPIKGSNVYLIPEGYVGPVVLVYGVSGGEDIGRDEEGASLYRIGKDGILFVREPAPSAGWYRNTYFYLAADGRRSEIPQSTKADKATLQIFGEVSGATGQSRDETRWRAFIVGAPDQMPNWREAPRTRRGPRRE